MSQEERVRSPRVLLPGQVAPDEADAAFWQGCRERQFLLYQCEVSARYYWPAGDCIDHGQQAMAWVPASGRGTVHTYTVFRRAFLPELANRIPYAIAVVALEEGPFFHSDIVGCGPDEVTVGMPVEVVWEVVDDATVIPHFAADPATGDT